MLTVAPLEVQWKISSAGWAISSWQSDNSVKFHTQEYSCITQLLHQNYEPDL